jgi:hypothetical protein
MTNSDRRLGAGEILSISMPRGRYMVAGKK